jgi:hypothetical protein
MGTVKPRQTTGTLRCGDGALRRRLRCAPFGGGQGRARPAIPDHETVRPSALLPCAGMPGIMWAARSGGAPADLLSRARAANRMAAPAIGHPPRTSCPGSPPSLPARLRVPRPVRGNTSSGMADVVRSARPPVTPPFGSTFPRKPGRRRSATGSPGTGENAKRTGATRSETGLWRPSSRTPPLPLPRPGRHSWEA